MNADLKELLKLLKSHNVEFVIIGAHAVSFYCRPRMTEALDIFVGASGPNAERLASALQEFGTKIGLAGMEAFSKRQRQLIRIGVPPNMVDILNFGGSIPFEEVYRDRVSGTLGGEEVMFPSIEHLLDMKRCAGRKKDEADIEALEAILDENLT